MKLYPLLYLVAGRPADSNNIGANSPAAVPATTAMLPPGMIAGSATGLVSWMVLGYRNPAMLSPENPRGLLGVASTFSAFIFTMAQQEALGNYFPALLNGVATAFYFPVTPTPEELYNMIWGYVQNQISATAIFNSKAQLVQSLISLTENLNQQVIGYLAELKLLHQTPESLQKLLDSNNGTLNASRSSVDVSMKAVDTILASSFDWFTPLSPTHHPPSTFILGSAKRGVCLHTKEFNIKDGTLVVVDNECDLNNLRDKSWSLDSRNRLRLQTSEGLKCLAYNDKNGKALAVFGIESRHCTKGHLITAKFGKDGQVFIYDGNERICVSSSTATKKMNTLVKRQKGHECKGNNQLYFETVIPIPFNEMTKDDPGTILEPARSFEEVGLQLLYFSKIAALHLLALKEWYNYGTLQRQAKYQFYTKVAEYKSWLEVVLPMYASYATLMNINSTDAIVEATVFYKALGNANLDISPMVWNLGVDKHRQAV